MRQRWVLVSLLFLQGVCAFFFISDIVSSVFGLRATPISWQTRELLEIAAALGLLLGLGLGWLALSRSLQRSEKAEQSLRVVRGAFLSHLEAAFAKWELTPAERDVALFSLKGFSTQEIAALRETSEGTVKAQSNAIYRKAGVNGRAQLLGLFIEDLIERDEGGFASEDDKTLSAD